MPGPTVFRSWPGVLADRRRRCARDGELDLPAHGSPLFTISRVVEACDALLGDGKTWPERTNRCCLWCTEGFPWVPVGVPRAYDERKDVFTLKWAFCSFNCAKAYMCDKGMKTDLLFYMALRLWGGARDTTLRLAGIREAPARETLRKFGGPLDITEFRGTPLCIKHGHPLDISIRCDPRLLTVTGGGGGAPPELAQLSRAARVSDLIPTPNQREQPRAGPERSSGSVSQLMKRPQAARKPPVRKGLDAFLRPVGAPPEQQLADRQAARGAKRARQ